MEVSQNMLLGGLLGGMVLIILVAILGGFLHSRRERLLAHAERMKALEMGLDMPDDAATARIKAVYGVAEKSESASGEPKSLAVQCFSQTGYICGAGFFFAMVAGSSHGVAYAMAAATGAIGVTGMICGTILASREPAHDRFASGVASKPRFDPESV